MRMFFVCHVVKHVLCLFTLQEFLHISAQSKELNSSSAPGWSIRLEWLCCFSPQNNNKKRILCMYSHSQTTSEAKQLDKHSGWLWLEMSSRATQFSNYKHHFKSDSFDILTLFNALNPTADDLNIHTHLWCQIGSLHPHKRTFPRISRDGTNQTGDSWLSKHLLLHSCNSPSHFFLLVLLQELPIMNMIILKAVLMYSWIYLCFCTWEHVVQHLKRTDCRWKHRNKKEITSTTDTHSTWGCPWKVPGNFNWSGMLSGKWWVCLRMSVRQLTLKVQRGWQFASRYGWRHWLWTTKCYMGKGQGYLKDCPSWGVGPAGSIQQNWCTLGSFDWSVPSPKILGSMPFLLRSGTRFLLSPMWLSTWWCSGRS